MQNYLHSRSDTFFMYIEKILTIFAILAVGTYMIYDSLKNFYKIWLIKKSDKANIHEAASNDNFVRIHGRAHKFKEILDSPIRNKKCFAYGYNIAKNTSNGALKNHNAWWKSLDEDQKSVEFMIEDDSGKARIDSGEISLKYTTIYMISNLSEIPKTVAENKIQIAKKGVKSRSNTLNLDKKIRFKEGTIQANDRIFVLGKFDNENGSLDVDSDEIIYISNRSTDEEINYLKKPAINSFIFGVIFVSSGLLVSL